jgi:excisionase family DNA binding protein
MAEASNGHAFLAARLLPRNPARLSNLPKEEGSKAMTTAHEVLTLKELCDLLRIHPSTIYKLLREGRIPSFRIGSEWRFRRDVILRWMAEKSESPQTTKFAHSGMNGGTRRRTQAISRKPMS